MKNIFNKISLSVIIFSLSCCSSIITKEDLQADNVTPASAIVKELEIPSNPQLPKYVLAIEPFRTANNTNITTSIDGSYYCKTANCRTTTAINNYGNNVSSQLETALSKVGNIALLDYSSLKINSQGKYLTKINKNERGLFLIRGNLTELSENIEANSKDNSVSLGWLGLVGGIVGALTDNPGLAYTGAGIFGANPNYKSEKKHRKGMVAFDIQIIDTRDMRIISSKRVNGTYASESTINGFGIFGYSNSNNDFAQSVLGQAMRIAMNEAVEKIWNDLKTK